jgi:hypothetical protein
LIKELRQEARTADGDDDFDGIGTGKDGNASMKAFGQMAKLRNRLHDHPDSIAHHVKLELGVKPGDVWSYEDYWKTMPFGKFRSVGWTAFCIAEAMEHLDAGRVSTANAVLFQSLKSAHHFALDQGNWKAAWPITLLKDPYMRAEFGGMEDELTAMSGRIKARSELKDKIQGRKDDNSSEEHEAAPDRGVAQGGGPGQPKGKKKSKGGQGAQ